MGYSESHGGFKRRLDMFREVSSCQCLLAIMVRYPRTWRKDDTHTTRWKFSPRAWIEAACLSILLAALCVCVWRGVVVGKGYCLHALLVWLPRSISLHMESWIRRTFLVCSSGALFRFLWAIKVRMKLHIQNQYIFLYQLLRRYNGKRLRPSCLVLQLAAIVQLATELLWEARQDGPAWTDPSGLFLGFY